MRIPDTNARDSLRLLAQAVDRAEAYLEIADAVEAGGMALGMTEVIARARNAIEGTRGGWVGAALAVGDVLAATREAHGLLWRLRYARHNLTLTVAPLRADGTADTAKEITVADYELDVPATAIRHFADYVIECRWASVWLAFQPEGEAVSW